jgi:hypothetical protein
MKLTPSEFLAPGIVPWPEPVIFDRMTVRQGTDRSDCSDDINYSG